MMVQILESLLFLRETQTEFWIPGFKLVSTICCEHLGSELVAGRSLPVSVLIYVLQIKVRKTVFFIAHAFHQHPEPLAGTEMSSAIAVLLEPCLNSFQHSSPGVPPELHKAPYGD